MNFIKETDKYTAIIHPVNYDPKKQQRYANRINSVSIAEAYKQLLAVVRK
jgi:hypothetical protein